MGVMSSIDAITESADAVGAEFPGIRTLTASEMFALDLNATALAEEAACCAAFWLPDRPTGGAS
jgi:hypothetical protein